MYRIFGGTQGIIDVYTINSAGYSRLWYKQGDQGVSWKMARVTLPKGMYQVLFRAFALDSTRITLDSIRLDLTAPCETGKFSS